MVNSPSGNVQLMQKINRLKVIGYIRANRFVSRPQIARETNLSLSSVTNIINYFEERALVSEMGTEDATRVGRKAALLKFNSDVYEYICVYIDSRGIHLARTNLSGKILDTRDVHASENNISRVLDTVTDAVREMRSRADCNKLLAVGVAVNGSVGDRSRLLMSASHRWTEFDIKAELEERLQIPVIVENVSVTNAKFQMTRYPTEKKTVFMDFDDGIGAVRYDSADLGRAQISEVGHTTVMRGGEKCFCGNDGCLELMCSPARLVTVFRALSDRALPENPESAFDKIAEYACNGDTAAVSAINECIDYLAIGIRNITMIFNPDRIMLNGGIYFKHSYIYERVIAAAGFSPLTGKKIEFCKTEMDTKNHLSGIALYMSDCIFDISYEYCII